MMIYKVTNKINGKIYIGLTTRSLSERIKEHLNDAINNRFNSHLHHAIRKHGMMSFNVVQIDNSDSIDELNKKEQYWIKFYNSTNKMMGYNNKEGGSHGKHLPETIEKIREAGKNRVCSESTREKLRKNIPPSHKGKKRSEETKRKMSDSLRGRIVPQYVLDCCHRANIGRHQSPEERAKRSAALKGKKKPDGMMEKLRLNNIGKKRSKETCAKISAATIGKHRGEKNTNAILKEIQVVQIKKDLANNERICAISRKYNISRQLIKNIKYRNSWRHVVV